MCAIVDANVAYEVFGSDRPPAGKRFFDWLSSPRGQLVVGGKLREELARDRRFVQWLRSALRNGRARSVTDEAVDDHAAGTPQEGSLQVERPACACARPGERGRGCSTPTTRR